MMRSPKIDATADKDGVTFETDGDVTIRVFTGGSFDKSDVSQAKWTLPGFTVSVDGSAPGFSKSKPAECEGCVDVTYQGVKKVRLGMVVEQ
jgi:hypothetical protein